MNLSKVDSIHAIISTVTICIKCVILSFVFSFCCILQLLSFLSSRFMNQYFLLIACLQLWSLITPVNPASTWGPLIFIFAVSATKEAWDDYNRYLSDTKANEKEVWIVRQGVRNLVCELPHPLFICNFIFIWQFSRFCFYYQWVLILAYRNMVLLVNILFYLHRYQKRKLERKGKKWLLCLSFTGCPFLWHYVHIHATFMSKIPWAGVPYLTRSVYNINSRWYIVVCKLSEFQFHINAYT